MYAFLSSSLFLYTLLYTCSWHNSQEWKKNETSGSMEIPFFGNNTKKPGIKRVCFFSSGGEIKKSLTPLHVQNGQSCWFDLAGELKEAGDMVSINLCVLEVQTLLRLSLFLHCCHVGAELKKDGKAVEVAFFFSLPVSNCSGGKLNLEAFTIQVLVRGLDVLDYSKLITGRVVAARPKFRNAFTSEIWDLVLPSYMLQWDCSLSLRVTSCFLSRVQS